MTERSRVHDVAPSDAVLSTPPWPRGGQGAAEQGHQPSGSRSTRHTFPFLVGTILKAAEIVRQWFSALLDRAT